MVEPRQSLSTARGVYGCEPFTGTPCNRAAAIELPPGESVGALWARDHAEDFVVMGGLNGWMAETRAGSHAKAGAFCVHHAYVASHGDPLCDGWGHTRSLGACQQRRVQTPGDEMLPPKGSELRGSVAGRIHLPFYGCSAEVLADHAWLHNQFTDRRSQRFGPALFEIEREEAEADVVPSLREVAAEAVTDHGLGHRRDSGRLVPEEFAKRAELHLAWTLLVIHALHPSSLEVLDQLAVLLEGLGDRGAPSLGAAFRLEMGQERLVNVVPGLREVCGRILLRLTRSERDQEQGRSQAGDGGDEDLVQHRCLGNRHFWNRIIAYGSHERQTSSVIWA